MTRLVKKRRIEKFEVGVRSGIGPLSNRIVIGSVPFVSGAEVVARRAAGSCNSRATKAGRARAPYDMPLGVVWGPPVMPAVAVEPVVAEVMVADETLMTPHALVFGIYVIGPILHMLGYM